MLAVLKRNRLPTWLSRPRPRTVHPVRGWTVSTSSPAHARRSDTLPLGLLYYLRKGMLNQQRSVAASLAGWEPVYGPHPTALLTSLPMWP